MPFQSQRALLAFDEDTRAILDTISRSRSEPLHRVERAKMMLAYADGETISAIARSLHTNRPKVQRCIDKALQLGAVTALEDVPRSGRPAEISAEARAWVVALACQKPVDLGYPEELWTTRLLANHVREHCVAAGHPSLAKLARGTVSKILSKHQIRPHKLSYYLERRDPEFDEKMAQVLLVYKQVQIIQEQQDSAAKSLTAYISYDEKPGIQAIGASAPDLPPVAGGHGNVGRDYEYKRHGTMTLMAGLDLVTGHIHNTIVDRHRSREFVDFLKQLDQHYPPVVKIRVILDNHSAHVSKETRAYLAKVPNRFEFIFTPKHGSWLNLVESFFSKVARTLLRGIRVESKHELKTRIQQYIDRLNEDPVIYRWTYKLDEISVA